MKGASVSPDDFTDVIESEEVIQYFHPALLHLDYEDTKVQISIITITLICYILQFVVTLFICNQFKSFRYLRLKHRVFMSLAVSRGVYGLSGIVFGGYSLFKTTNLDRDVVFGKTATTYFAMTYTVGFFIFELGAVIVSDIAFKSFSKMLLTHHSLALMSYTMALVYGANHSFGCRGLVLEMSTPFSCLCFVLLKAGKENSIAWKVNQITLVHTFHLRSVVECYFWYVTYCKWSHIFGFMPVPLLVLLYTSLTLISLIMTPYWGYKKTQQLFNPVDWNFQESRDAPTFINGQSKKIV